MCYYIGDKVTWRLKMLKQVGIKEFEGMIIARAKNINYDKVGNCFFSTNENDKTKNIEEENC